MSQCQTLYRWYFAKKGPTHHVDRTLLAGYPRYMYTWCMCIFSILSASHCGLLSMNITCMLTGYTNDTGISTPLVDAANLTLMIWIIALIHNGRGTKSQKITQSNRATLWGLQNVPLLHQCLCTVFGVFYWDLIPQHGQIMCWWYTSLYIFWTRWWHIVS